MSPMRCLLTMFLLLSVAGWLPAAEDAVKVTQQRSVVTRVTFDPDQPPKDMPPLVNGESAVTRSSFSFGSEVEVQIGEETVRSSRHISTVKVTAVKIITGLAITLWLPRGAPRELVQHEEGHRRLGERYYKDAGSIARRLAGKCIGQNFTGEGKTTEAARKAAMNKAMASLSSAYMQATQIPSARVNQIFDDITSHGQDQDISVNEAMAVSIDLYRKEERRE